MFSEVFSFSEMFNFDEIFALGVICLIQCKDSSQMNDQLNRFECCFWKLASYFECVFGSNNVAVFK